MNTAATCPDRRAQDSSAFGVGAITIGTLVALRAESAIPLVIYEGQPRPEALDAQSTVDLHGEHIGRQVALAFESGDPCRPIILGCIRGTGDPVRFKSDSHVAVDIDGERLIVSAAEQLVFRCGQSSITLTKAGKVIVKGTFIASVSSGVHRIKGGSVQIN